MDPHPLIEVRKHHRPRLVVLLHRFVVREARVCEPHERPAAVRSELERHHGFSPFRCRRHPCQLDQSIALEFEKRP